MSKREPLPPAGGERAAGRRERAAEMVDALREAYPDAHCALHYETPFQLLIAVALSAQCTDARVNQVTPALFAAYPDAEAMADAPIEELEQLVQSTGFFRQKAKNILATAQRIVDVYDGVMPDTMEELVTMPGAARKTASVVIADCFPENIDGIAVDTHVQRIARRMRLTIAWETPKIERELMKILPRDSWHDFTHLMIDHGRAICKAPKPLCSQCPEPIASRCPSRGRWCN